MLTRSRSQSSSQRVNGTLTNLGNNTRYQHRHVPFHTQVTYKHTSSRATTLNSEPVSSSEGSWSKLTSRLLGKERTAPQRKMVHTPPGKQPEHGDASHEQFPEDAFNKRSKLSDLYEAHIRDNLQHLQLKQAQTTRYDPVNDEQYYPDGEPRSDAEGYEKYNIADEINKSNQPSSASSRMLGRTPDGRVKKPSFVRKIGVPPPHTSRLKYGDYTLYTGAHCSDIFISLHSNLGDSPLIIREALDMINDIPETRISAVSPMFSTPPRRGTSQPKFSVTIRVSSTIVPKSLLGQLDRIQLDLGKILYALDDPKEGKDKDSRLSRKLRREQTIDINLLSYGALSLEERSPDPHDLNLRLPHRSLRDLEVAYGLASLVTIDSTPCPSVYGSLIKNREFWHPDESLNLTEMLLLPRKNKPIIAVTPMFKRRDFFHPQMAELTKNEALMKYLKPDNLDLYQFPELHALTQYKHRKKPPRLKHPTKISTSYEPLHEHSDEEKEHEAGEEKQESQYKQTRLLPPNTLVAAHLQTWPSRQVEEYRVKNMLLLQNDKTIKFANAIDNSMGLTKQIVVVIAGEAFDAVTLKPCHKPSHPGIDYLSPDTTLDVTHIVPFPLTFLLLPVHMKIAVAQGLSLLQQGVNMLNVSAHSLNYDIDRTKTIEQMSYSTTDVIWFLRQAIDLWEELGQYSEDVALMKQVSSTSKDFTPVKVRVDTSRWLEAMKIASDALTNPPTPEQLQSQKDGLFTEGFFNTMHLDNKDPATRSVFVNTLLNAFNWDMKHPILIKQKDVLGHEQDTDSDIERLKLLLANDSDLKQLRDHQIHSIKRLGTLTNEEDELLQFLFDSTGGDADDIDAATRDARDREYLRKFLDTHLPTHPKAKAGDGAEGTPKPDGKQVPKKPRPTTILDDIRSKPRKYNHDGDQLDLVDPRKVYESLEEEEKWNELNPMSDNDQFTDDDDADGSTRQKKGDVFEPFYKEGESQKQHIERLKMEQQLIDSDENNPYNDPDAMFDPAKMALVDNPHPDLPFLNQLRQDSEDKRRKQEAEDLLKYPPEPPVKSEKERFERHQNKLKTRSAQRPRFEEDDLGVLEGAGGKVYTRTSSHSVISIYPDSTPSPDDDGLDADGQTAILLSKASHLASQQSVDDTHNVSAALSSLSLSSGEPAAMSRKDILRMRVRGSAGLDASATKSVGDRNELQQKLGEVEQRIAFMKSQSEKPSSSTTLDTEVMTRMHAKRLKQDRRIQNMDVTNLSPEDALLFDDVKQELLMEKEVQDALIDQQRQEYQRVPKDVKLRQVELIRQHERILSLPVLNIQRCDTIKGTPYVSIFTCHAPVALRGVMSGADIIHDFGFAAQDRYMMTTMSALGIPVIVGHMRGTLQNMNSIRVRRTFKEDKDRIDAEHAEEEENGPEHAVSHLYRAEARHFHNSYLAGISDDLLKFLFHASRNGIPLHNIIVDPGIGLSKSGLADVSLPNNITALLPSSIPLPMFYSTARLPQPDAILAQTDLTLSNSIQQRITDTSRHLDQTGKGATPTTQTLMKQQLSIYKHNNIIKPFVLEQQLIEQSMLSTSVYSTPQNGLESMTGGVVGTSSRLAVVEVNDPLRARVVIEIGNTVGQMENYARDDIKM